MGKLDDQINHWGKSEDLLATLFRFHQSSNTTCCALTIPYIIYSKSQFCCASVLYIAVMNLYTGGNDGLLV